MLQWKSWKSMSMVIDYVESTDMFSTDLQIDDALRAAIVVRLEFRKYFLRALDLELPLDHISYSWPPVLSSVQNLKTTHQLGRPVPGAFSTKMQRRLASTVPPRPIVDLAFPDALEKLLQLATDCAEATRFTSLPTDPLEYQSFLWHFASRSPAPLPYARSYLASFLFSPTVLQSSTSLPLADIASLVFPHSPVLEPGNWSFSPPLNPLLPKPPRLQFALLADEFVDRAGGPYMDLWVALGQNRCRLRRLLTHVIAAWDLLQGDAALVDSDIARAATALSVAQQVLPNSLATWTYARKLWMVEKILLLGFEQDVYLPDEFGGTYLFLSLITTRRADLLRTVQTHFDTRIQQLLAARQPRDAHAVETLRTYIASLVAEATGIAALSLALARFYIILLYLHALPVPPRPFATEKLRYEVRMKPFLGLDPPEVPPFEDFAAHTQPFGTYTSPDAEFWTQVKDGEAELWAEIDRSVKSAKDAFAEVKKLGARAAKAEGVEGAWAREVQSALASCVALGVAVAGVKDAVGKMGPDGKVGVRIEVPESGKGRRYAEGWVVVRVVKT
jgi:hypothetical protein